jgi:arsenite-transporting ATPase
MANSNATFAATVSGSGAAGGSGATADAPLSAGELAPYQYLFLTGKGGVGKTSVSCAVACALADAGRRVLLVTTDPASNLGDVFGQPIGMEPTPIPACPGLEAEEVDPVRLAARYRDGVVAPYRGVLPDDAIANIEEQLSGSCTVEIAAFDRFASLLSSAKIAQTYDNVIFDTAPTGHTLRMLELPSAWTPYLNQNTTGTSCLASLLAWASGATRIGARWRCCATPIPPRSCWYRARRRLRWARPHALPRSFMAWASGPGCWW